MSYTLHMTNRAESDIAEAVAYTTHTLLNPQAADSLLDTVESSLFTLTEYPFRHALADAPVLQAYGIRFIQIERYLAFYTVSQDENRVHIIRFLHEKRSWSRLLRKEFSY